MGEMRSGFYAKDERWSTMQYCDGRGAGFLASPEIRWSRTASSRRTPY